VRKTRWSDTGPIFVLGLSLLLVFLLLSLAGYNEALFIISLILTPLTAFSLSVFGLWVFSRGSEERDDQIQTLYLWVSIGLLMLSLSEIAATLVNVIQSPLPIEVTVGLIQMPGLLLWGFGILHYLRSVNSALEFIESGKLWSILLIITTLATICLVVMIGLYYPWVGLVENIVLSPLVIGMLLFTVVALGLVSIFRHGEFVNPLFLIFIGFFLYFIRTVQWTFATSVLGTPSNSIFALEACVFFGAAFILARNLRSPEERM